MEGPPIVRRTRSGGASAELLSLAPLPAARQRSAGAPSPAPDVSAALALPPPPPPPPAAECALYWDYENMPLGANLSYTQFETLLSRVRTFGRITEARLYCDSEKGTLARAHRGHVERLGVNLVDCPTSDKKEAVDKKIIVDCLVWAVARAAKSQPCAVVLISGDGDFAHMLSRLNNLGVRTIAIGRSRVLQSVAVTSLTLREACGAEVGSPPPSGRGTKRPAAAAAGPSSSRASPAPGAKRQKAAAAAAPKAPKATPKPRSKPKPKKSVSAWRG